MPRILSVRNPANQNKAIKNPRFGTKLAGSFHDAAQLVGRTRRKASVRTLSAPFTGQQGGPGVTYKTTGGSTNWKSSPAAKGLTDNPNAKFDPSPQPGSVTKERAVNNANVRGIRGHAKTLKNFTGSSAFRGMKIKKR